jgi:hypothetical protein
VYEQAGLSPNDVVAMEKANEQQFPGEVSLITIGGSIKAEFNYKGTFGGVVMSINNTWVDIAGPALPPETAKVLAETFA